MTMREAFVKERNDALFSLDRKKIEAYCAKHGDTETAELPDQLFWAGVYKAICAIRNAPEDKVREARTWLTSHGFSDTIRL